MQCLKIVCMQCYLTTTRWCYWVAEKKLNPAWGKKQLQTRDLYQSHSFHLLFEHTKFTNMKGNSAPTTQKYIFYTNIVKKDIWSHTCTLLTCCKATLTSIKLQNSYYKWRTRIIIHKCIYNFLKIKKARLWYSCNRRFRKVKFAWVQWDTKQINLDIYYLSFPVFHLESPTSHSTNVE